MTLDAEIFSDLPHHLRQTIASHVMARTISSLRLFKLGQEKGLEALVAQHMRPVDVAPGERGGAGRGSNGFPMCALRLPP